MYSIEEWDGLAKVGVYETIHGEMVTPALLPVVDPSQQDIPIREFETKFGFTQVITSAYLMSKRLGHMNFSKYPKVHEYLDFDGTIMMDSGAYQVMLYGDIELGVEDTIKLQKLVNPDIGVLMDHPIGDNVSYEEAEQRVKTTIKNVRHSIQFLENTQIKWTLPIQGGRYLNLLDTYLDEVTKPEIIDHFDFYALGSVVPVMINQDYSTLVDMITLARNKLPVDRPFHLFGAGHPSMFALATFLGCDTFDSAAYVLMAKEGRYMTVDGTYHISELEEFPCPCQICSTYTPSSLRNEPKNIRTKLLSEHNLWVSAAEIRRIRMAIRSGTLWDLVLQRASAVPNLAKATNLAIKNVTTGDLSSRYKQGIPITKGSSIRMTKPKDYNKISLKRTRILIKNMISGLKGNKLIVVAFSMAESIYNKIPDNQILDYDIGDKNHILLYLPPFGLIPIGLNEVYPIGQLINEVNLDKFDTSTVKKQLIEITQNFDQTFFVIPEEWPESFLELINADKLFGKIIRSQHVVRTLREILT